MVVVLALRQLVGVGAADERLFVYVAHIPHGDGMGAVAGVALVVPGVPDLNDDILVAHGAGQGIGGPKPVIDPGVRRRRRSLKALRGHIPIPEVCHLRIAGLVVVHSMVVGLTFLQFVGVIAGAERRIACAAHIPHGDGVGLLLLKPHSNGLGVCRPSAIPVGERHRDSFETFSAGLDLVRAVLKGSPVIDVLNAGAVLDVRQGITRDAHIRPLRGVEGHDALVGIVVFIVGHIADGAPGVLPVHFISFVRIIAQLPPVGSAVVPGVVLAPDYNADRLDVLHRGLLDIRRGHVDVNLAVHDRVLSRVAVGGVRGPIPGIIGITQKVSVHVGLVGQLGKQLDIVIRREVVPLAPLAGHDNLVGQDDLVPDLHAALDLPVVERGIITLGAGPGVGEAAFLAVHGDLGAVLHQLHTIGIVPSVADEQVFQFHVGVVGHGEGVVELGAVG